MQQKTIKFTFAMRTLRYKTPEHFSAVTTIRGAGIRLFPVSGQIGAKERYG